MERRLHSLKHVFSFSVDTEIIIYLYFAKMNKRFLSLSKDSCSKDILSNGLKTSSLLTNKKVLKRQLYEYVKYNF